VINTFSQRLAVLLVIAELLGGYLGHSISLISDALR